MNGTVVGSVVGGMALLSGGLYLTYAYVPRPRSPELNASVIRETLTVDGHIRSFVAVVPRRLPPGAPLLLVFHGSMQNGQGIRQSVGYAFDKLAMQHGFIAVYPDAYKGAWHDCRAAADFPARRENIDDVRLTRALIAHFETKYQIDSAKVFAAGYSNGGQMVFRLAAEAPGEFAGFAAIAATQPTDDNFSCAAPSQPVPMLLIGGTGDPIVPYEGGMVSLFGLQPRGRAQSFDDTAQFYAGLNGVLTAVTERPPPHTGTSEPTAVMVRSYEQVGRPPVTAYTVQGGGHVVPGPASAFPRMLGWVDRQLDAPAVIWSFFADLSAKP